MTRDDPHPFTVYSFLVCMGLAMGHGVLYSQARPVIVQIMMSCGDGEGLLLYDIADATYVVAWHNMHEAAPYWADVVWRWCSWLPLPERHPAVQRLSEAFDFIRLPHDE